MHHPQSSDADLPDLSIHADKGHDIMEQISSIQIELVPGAALQYCAEYTHSEDNRSSWSHGIIPQLSTNSAIT